MRSHLANDIFLRCTWHRDWDSSVEQAIRQLPSDKGCPHELLRTLFSLAGPSRRIAVVRAGDVPVAVVPIERGAFEWKPVSMETTARLAAVLPGWELRTLRSLDLPIRIEYWPGCVPEGTQRRNWSPAHRLHPGTDSEKYWKEHGRWKSLKKARNRTIGFEFEVDSMEAVRWTIDGWACKWFDPTRPLEPITAPRLATGEALLGTAYHTFRLMEHSTAAAGQIALVHENELFMLHSYRNPDYDWHGAGNRLTELVVEWCLEHELIFNLGGGFEYKEEWAPEDGGYWQFSVIPLRHRALEIPSRGLERGWEITYKAVARIARASKAWVPSAR